ncbi:hypothetical protein CHS0354_000683 [Potamilus streckersoni]|uniref:AAA+ ATPase domain-containing protein n=1 Tax=Potamilus streckersoni TaxID=2493646 RepID=A0AAE0T892_9BIVA|nr:hypothetical protein CHS0354_000683 [Potamilus streckersoni]
MAKESFDSTKKRFQPVREGNDQYPKKPNKDQSRFNVRNFLIVAVVIFLVFLVQRSFTSQSALKEVSYSTYTKLLGDSLIKSAQVVVDGRIAIIYGQLRGESTVEDIDRKTVELSKFKVKVTHFDKSMMDALLSKNVVLTMDVQAESAWDWLLFFSPLIILGVVYFVFMQRNVSQNSVMARTMMGFGRSRAKLMTEFDVNVRFSDVAGCNEAKEDLEEVVDFLKYPQKFLDIGAKIPKGVLLLGPPGTGKTLLAKAVAGEAKVPFFSMSGSDFVEMFVGVGASRVRDLFEQAKQHSPCIVFIDEIDAVGRQRGAGVGGGHDEREQTLNQLLVEMDGFSTNTNVMVMAATNRADVLDSALLRPGRFDRQIMFDLPNVKDRHDILKIHTKKVPIDETVNLERIAKLTPGFSGADLANLINESSLLAARNNRKTVSIEHVEQARDKILMGPERKSDVLTDKQKELTAYHESGHVLVAKLSEGTDPIHKVTIIPRGRALGVTSYLPESDLKMYHKKYILSVITYILGGRAAEEVVFSDVTTGASNDIEKATLLARRMVCEWGMTENLGPVNYGSSNHEVFLGRDYGKVQSFSEETSKFIDKEVRSIIDGCMANARKIIQDNLDTMKRLTKQLIEKETLTGEEIDAIISNSGVAKHDVDAVVNAFIGTIIEAMKAHKRIEIRGFVTFTVKKTSKRLARNPRTAVLTNYRYCSKCGAFLDEPRDVEGHLQPLPQAEEVRVGQKGLSQGMVVVIVVSFLGVVSLLGAFGWSAMQTEQKGFDLSGAAGKDAQPETGKINSEQLESPSMAIEKALDEVSLKKINEIRTNYFKANKLATKKELALSLSEIFLSFKYYDSAGVYFERASLTSTEKKDVEDYALKAAHVFHDSKNLKEAIRMYSKVLELNPMQSDARVDFALTLIESGEMMQGVSEMKKAVELTPLHQKANLNLGILYAQINRVAEAKKYWQNAAEIDPTSEAGTFAQELLKKP